MRCVERYIPCILFFLFGCIICDFARSAEKPTSNRITAQEITKINSELRDNSQFDLEKITKILPLILNDDRSIAIFLESQEIAADESENGIHGSDLSLLISSLGYHANKTKDNPDLTRVKKSMELSIEIALLPYRILDRMEEDSAKDIQKLFPTKGEGGWYTGTQILLPVMSMRYYVASMLNAIHPYKLRQQDTEIEEIYAQIETLKQLNIDFANLIKGDKNALNSKGIIKDLRKIQQEVMKLQGQIDRVSLTK